MLQPRTYLFVPALEEKMILKASGTEADTIIIDLEDSVACSEKETTREMICAFLKKENIPDKRVFIRINDPKTIYFKEDISMCADAGVDGVMIPKAETADDIRKVTAVTGEDISLLPLIETAKGIRNIYDIAQAHPCVERLAFGSIDYSLDIDCALTSTGEELLYARSKLVNDSRAAGIGAPIDAVFPDLNDEEGLKQEACQSKRLGFKGKMIIHPNQIVPVHDVFSPTEAEIDAYRQMVEKFEQAEKEGRASIEYKGQMVDYPVYKKAKKIVDVCHAVSVWGDDNRKS